MSGNQPKKHIFVKTKQPVSTWPEYFVWFSSACDAEYGIVIQPMTALPQFSLGKYSRCLSPNFFGNLWNLSVDKLLNTNKKAGTTEKWG